MPVKPKRKAAEKPVITPNKNPKLEFDVGKPDMSHSQLITEALEKSPGWSPLTLSDIIKAIRFRHHFYKSGNQNLQYQIMNELVQNKNFVTSDKFNTKWALSNKISEQMAKEKTNVLIFKQKVIKVKPKLAKEQKCEFCDFVYETETDLLKHFQDKHVKEVKHQRIEESDFGKTNQELYSSNASISIKSSSEKDPLTKNLRNKAPFPLSPVIVSENELCNENAKLGSYTSVIVQDDKNVKVKKYSCDRCHITFDAIAFQSVKNKHAQICSGKPRDSNE